MSDGTSGDGIMTSAIPKPRAGEYVPKDFFGNCQRCGACPPFTNCPEGCGDREECIRLRERELALVEVLQAVVGSVPFSHMHLPLKTRIEYLLAKHGR